MSKSDRKVTVGTKSGSKLSKSGSVFDRLGDSREKHKKWNKKELDDIEKSSRSTKKAVIESADKTRKKKLASKNEVQHKSAKEDGSKIVRKKYEDDSRHFKSYKPISKNHPKSISSEEGHRHRIHKMENLIIEKRVSPSPPRHGSRSDSYSSNRSKKGAKKRQHNSLIENPERLQRYQSKSPINRSNEKERGRSRELKKKHVKDPSHKSRNSDQDNIKYRENTEKFKESGKAPKPIQKTEYKELPKQKKKLKQTKEVMDSNDKRSQESGRTKVKAIKISSKKSQDHYEKDSYVYEDTSDDYRELTDVPHKSAKKVVKKHAEHKMKREMAIEQDVIKPKRKRFEAPGASLHHSIQYGSRSQSSDDRDGRRDDDYKHKTQSSSKNLLVKSKQEKVDKYHGGHSKQYSLKEDIAKASSVKSYKKEYYSKSSQGSDVDVHDSYSSNSAEESKKKKKIRKKKRKETNPELKDVDGGRYDEDRVDKIEEKQNKKLVKKRMGKRKREDRSPSYSDTGGAEDPAKQQHGIMLEKGKHHKKTEIHTAQDFRDEERSHKQITNRKVEEKRIFPLYRTDKTHSRLGQKLPERGQQVRERHGKDQYKESGHSNRSHPKHVPEKLRTSEYSTPQHHHHPTYMKSVKHHQNDMKSVKHHQNDRVQVSTSQWTNDTGRKQARHVRPPPVSVSQPDRHYETPLSKFIPQRNMLDPTYPLPSSRQDHFPRSHSKDSWERNREPAPSRHFIKDHNAPRSRSRSGFSPSKHPMKHIYSQQDNYETTRREREFQSTSRNNSNERQRERQLRSKSRDSRSSSQRVDRIMSPHQRSSAYSDKSDHYDHHHDVVDSVGHRMKKPLKSKDSTISKSQERHNSRPRIESELTSRIQDDYNTKTRKYRASRSGSSHRQSSEKPPPKLDDVYRGSKNQRPPAKRHMSQHTRVTNDHVRKQKIGSSQGNMKVKKNRDSTLDSATDKRSGKSSTKQKKDSNASSVMGDKELGSLIENEKDKRKATDGPTDVLNVGWNELPSQKPSDEREAKPRSSVLEKFSPEFILSQTGIVTSLLRPDILEKVKEMQQAARTNNENANRRTSVKAMLHRGLNVYTEENVRKRLLGYNTRYRHPLVPPLIINAKTYMAAMKTYKLAVKLPVETM